MERSDRSCIYKEIICDQSESSIFKHVYFKRHLLLFIVHAKTQNVIAFLYIIRKFIIKNRYIVMQKSRHKTRTIFAQKQA